MTMTNARPLATARRLATLMLAAVLGACALCLAAPQQEAQAESYKTLYTWTISNVDGDMAVRAKEGEVDLIVNFTDTELRVINATFQEIPQSTLRLYKEKGGFEDVSLPAVPLRSFVVVERPWSYDDPYVRAELLVASDDPAGVYVTFDLNGHGKFPGNLVLEDDGTYREQLTNDMPIIAPTPTDDDYEFTGWAYENGDPAEDFHLLETSVTVYAQWEPKPASGEPGDGGNGNGGDDEPGTAGDDSDADSDDEYVTSPATGVTAASAEESPAIPAAVLTALLTAACAAAFALRERLQP